MLWTLRSLIDQARQVEAFEDVGVRATGFGFQVKRQAFSAIFGR